MFARLRDLARARRGDGDREDGFTLIELLVVIVIIGILVAIAIPAYLHQKEKGVDAGVKSDLHAAATALESALTDGDVATIAADPKTAIDAEGFKLTTGNVIEVFVDTDGSYCFRGSNPSGSEKGADTTTYLDFYYYDSTNGGVQGSSYTPAGPCAVGNTFASLS